MKTIVTSVEQMQQLGEKIGKILKPGDVVVLTG
jgi:tRNA A37 threonylcarbamoyladenosine biosynthesis protein TsaE